MSTPRYITKEKGFPAQVEYGDFPPELQFTPEEDADRGSDSALLKHRRRAEEEAARDLDKTHEQLFADIHDETTNQNKTEDKILLANRRLAAVIVRATISNDAATVENLKLQGDVRRLTDQIKWLTVIILILTAIQAIAACKSSFN